MPSERVNIFYLQLSDKLANERNNLKEVVKLEMKDEVQALEKEVTQLKNSRDKDLQQLYSRYTVNIAYFFIFSSSTLYPYKKCRFREINFQTLDILSQYSHISLQPHNNTRLIIKI